MTNYAYVFPGQGSQSVGMMTDWEDHQSTVVDIFTEASDSLGYDLWAVVSEGPAEQLNQTATTQPAMLCAGVASWRIAAAQQQMPQPAMMAGHSLGEYSALVCAGSLSLAEAVKLVAKRGYLMQSAKLRESVKKILGKLGRLIDGKLLIPEEVVHYSEWLHVMRDEIAKRQVIDCSHIRATVHPACHVYKMVPEDAIYDDKILGGNRVAVTTGVLEALGTQVIDYRTWYDCCGFGFRHIISEREFTRSFAIDRKLRVAQEEARADMMVGHDTGCITTLDKNQWIGAAAGKPVDLPVLADCQFAALVCGAHPYKIVQSHWHASSTETLMEKLGIDWEAKKAEFEAYLKDVEAGRGESLYDPRKMITSGPGFKRIEQQ